VCYLSFLPALRPSKESERTLCTSRKGQRTGAGQKRLWLAHVHKCNSSLIRAPDGFTAQRLPTVTASEVRSMRLYPSTRKEYLLPSSLSPWGAVLLQPTLPSAGEQPSPAVHEAWEPKQQTITLKTIQKILHFYTSHPAPAANPYFPQLFRALPTILPTLLSPEFLPSRSVPMTVQSCTDSTN